MAGHADAIRLLERFGFSLECRLPGFGASGVTFLQYAWRLNDHVSFQITESSRRRRRRLKVPKRRGSGGALPRARDSSFAVCKRADEEPAWPIRACKEHCWIDEQGSRCVWPRQIFRLIFSALSAIFGAVTTQVDVFRPGAKRPGFFCAPARTQLNLNSISTSVEIVRPDG